MSLVPGLSRRQDAQSGGREGSSEEKVGPSTIRKILISVATLLRWAVMEGLLDSNPADTTRVKRPSEPASTSRVLTDEEYGRLLGVCPAWLATLVRWACATGMDKGQSIHLLWGNLDLRRDGTLAWWRR